MKIYSSPRATAQVLDCAFPILYDSYNMCDGGCKYCFATALKDFNPAIKLEKHKQLKCADPNRMEKVLNGEVEIFKPFIEARFPLQAGGLSEPFLHEEDKYGISLKVLKIFLEHDYKVRICTKGDTMLNQEYIDVIEQKPELFSFLISIITDDEKKYKIIEPNVPIPERRFEVIRTLLDIGCDVILRLRPYMLDVSSPNIIDKAAEYGASGVSTEFLCYDTRSKLMQTRMKKTANELGIKDFDGFYKKNRGSSSAYIRLRKGVESELIREMYLKAKEHKMKFGVSDPNFKEISDSGSCCCAFPDDHYPFNLTELLVKARKKVWAGANYADFSYSDIEEGINNYLPDPQLLQFLPISAKTKDQLRYQKVSIASWLRLYWNSPNHASSVYKYLQGKVLPWSIDKNENVVYRYYPSEWELNLRDKAKEI